MVPSACAGYSTILPCGCGCGEGWPGKLRCSNMEIDSKTNLNPQHCTIKVASVHAVSDKPK